jgi:hypothetical protein
MPSATTSASVSARVEVVISVQRRRRWSLHEKLQITLYFQLFMSLPNERE